MNSIKDLESRFHSVFESAIDGIIIINQKGVIVDVNEATCKLFLYNKSELLGNKVNTLMPEDHAVKHDTYINNYQSTRNPKIIGIGREVVGMKKDGIFFPFWLAVNEINLESGVYYTGFIHDLTLVKQVEKELVTLNEGLEKKVVERTYDLEKVVNQLLQLNKKLEDEVSARKFTEDQLKQREAELKKSLEKEKELGELKSRFVSMASHEFRTPLSTITSSASLIYKYKDEETQLQREKHILKIKSSVTHLTNILNDFLSISKLEEGKINIRLIECNLNDLVNEITDEIKPIINIEKTFEIKITLSDEMFITDPLIIKNILFNLISNAAKYTKSNGLIQLTVEDDLNYIHIGVHDNGIGIPEADQKHLFDRFFRAVNAANIEGTGLGLFIVKKYTELLNGEISFKSEESHGTTFEIILPKNHLEK